MKTLDIILQRWRYSKAAPFIPEGCDLLDIGGFDGSFCRRVSGKIKSAVCIDPHLEPKEDGKIRFIRASVAARLPFPDASFNVITLFAVYEHLGEVRKAITAELFRISPRKCRHCADRPDGESRFNPEVLETGTVD